MPYHVAKNSPEISHNCRNVSARTSFIFYFLFLRRDRKAYANNPSYRLPFTVIDEELTGLSPHRH